MGCPDRGGCPDGGGVQTEGVVCPDTCCTDTSKHLCWAIPVNIRTPPTDEQICPGVEHLLPSMSRGGTSLTSMSRGECLLPSMSRGGTSLTLHDQGWKRLLPSMSRGGTSLTLHVLMSLSRGVHEIKLSVRGHHSFW